MLIKTFSATSCTAALKRAREAMGPSAVVLETRRVSGGVEVIVAAQRPTVIKPKPLRRTKTTEPRKKPTPASTQRLKPTVDPRPVVEPPIIQPPVIETPDIEARIREEIVEPPSFSTKPPPMPRPVPEIQAPVKTNLANGSRRFVEQVAQVMSRQGFAETIVRSVVSRAHDRFVADSVKDRGSALSSIRALIAEVIPRPKGGEAPGPRLHVMVGSPGVGKTTTIAKLAARQRLQEGRTIVLASCDDQRLSGVEQLARYAEVLGVPFRVIRSAHELAQARQMVGDHGTLFVDTPGVSRNANDLMNSLSETLRGVRRDEIELLLAADNDTETLIETAARFQPLSPGCVNVTRVDETARPGQVISALSAVALPVLHVGNGPEVPKDLEPAHPRQLATWALPPHGLIDTSKETS